MGKYTLVRRIVITISTIILVCSGYILSAPAADQKWQGLLKAADSAAELQFYDSVATLAPRIVSLVDADSSCPDSLAAAVYTQVGECLTRVARYDLAEPYLQHALTAQQQLFGTDHRDVARTLEILSLVKLRQANLVYAEYLARDALRIRENDPATKPLELAASREALATVIRYTKSKLPECEQLVKRALAIRKQQPGARPVDYAATMFKLASVYRVWDQVPKADTIFQELLNIYVNAYGPADRRVGTTIFNLGNLNLYLGNYELAEDYLQRGLKINLEYLPEEHPTIALMYFNIGVTLRCMGRFAESIDYVNKALEIWEATSGPDHPDAAGAVEELARLYAFQDNHEESLRLLTRALVIRQQEFRDNYYLLPEQKAREYSNKVRLAISDYLSCYFRIDSPSSSVTEEACEWVLKCKGELSEAMYKRARHLHGSSDPALGALGDSVRVVRQELADHYARGYETNGGKSRLFIDSLEQLLSRLETDFAMRSAAIDSASRQAEWSVAELQKLLPDSTALLEFMRYGPPESDPDMDTNFRYVAAVITDSGADLIDLGPASAVNVLVSEYQSAANAASGDYMLAAFDSGEKSSALLRSMYDQIWRPVESAVGDAPTVLVCPDGALNCVSFATLKHDNRYLIEEHELHYLSASRDLRRLLDDHEPTGTGLLAMGGPDYNAAVADRLQSLDTIRDLDPEFDQPSGFFATRNPRSDCEYFHDVTLTALPYTRREISQVASCWRDYFRESVNVLSGAAASEENFKRNAPGRRAIHVATHGFFRPAVCNDTASTQTALHGDDPLLSSGLFLAGSNLHGEGANTPGAEDGLLTALEVSCLDLTGTQLVVLSACQTGLGTIQSGEGVYGLRRAFQMAGARTVVSTLWKIPDKETGSLMASLYKYSGSNLATALRQIALDRIHKQRLGSVPETPFTWGSFVAVGDWRLH